MDNLLADQRAAEQQVRSLLNVEDTPFSTFLAAFDTYRTLSQVVIFADFADAEKHGNRLWLRHTETRQYLWRTLKNIRKQKDHRSVEARVAVDRYLRFVKQSTRFYRGHVYKLSTTFGGIAELQAVAQQVKRDAPDGESHDAPVSPALHKLALRSCHQTLVYLGDLCRYRASDLLDKEQDFGPAVGFYGLACTICPDSGWGHHQLAVLALEQRHHLRAIYHLYRSILVSDPFALATNNLKIEFEKSNAAWDKGELIEKGPPNDPDAGKKALVGWFVRLHSMCAKGETFRGYDELERELLGRLAAELRHRSLDANLIRMVFVNIAAQHTAMENYRDAQTPQNEHAFYVFMRINLLFFTSLLELLRDDLLDVSEDAELAGAELVTKLMPITLRILPALRLYSSWLLLNTHLVQGLASNVFLAMSIQRFWHLYARTLDLVAADFPIWDLEDSPELTYMLEEDAETLGFLPLSDDGSSLTKRLWYDKQTGALKARFSDRSVARLSDAEEMLARILGFLEAGSFVANNIDHTPVNIRGTRFVLGDDEPFVLPVPPAPPMVEEPRPIAKPVTLSYAAAAAVNGRPSAAQPSSKQIAHIQKSRAAGTKSKAHQAQRDVLLMRMVDDLVDDDDEANPITPPQRYSTSPAVVGSDGDLAHEAQAPDFTQLGPGTKKGFTVATRVPAPLAPPESKPHTPHRGIPLSPSEADFKLSPRSRTSGDRLDATSPPWTPPSVASAAAAGGGFPSGLPTASLSSPAPRALPLHERVGSTNSAHSRGSRSLGESWSSLDSAQRPKHIAEGPLSNGMRAAGLTGGDAALVDGAFEPAAYGGAGPSARPLLFGAAPSVWSALPAPGPRAGFGG